MPHIHEKIDFTATGYIVYNSKVLLRYHDKHNIWLGVGGHIELDESPDVAIVREAKEEAGLDTIIYGQTSNLFEDHSQDLPVPFALNRHPINEVHDHIDFIYALKANSDIISPGEGEIFNPEYFKWLSLQELQDFSEVDNRVRSHAMQALNIAKKLDNASATNS